MASRRSHAVLLVATVANTSVLVVSSLYGLAMLNAALVLDIAVFMRPMTGRALQARLVSLFITIATFLSIPVTELIGVPVGALVAVALFSAMLWVGARPLRVIGPSPVYRSWR